MTGRAGGLSDFAEAVIAPEAAIPPGVTDAVGRVSRKRFGVYRNNVSSTMIEALGDNFPACREIVGGRFFDAVADAYHRAHPPRSPMLFRFGDTFAAFLDTFEPAASVPYLADVARVEWAWLEAFHAADATVASAEALGAIAPERLADMRLVPHPAVRTVRSSWPVVAIVSRIRNDRDLADLDMGRGEDALVTRPDVTVELRTLPPGASVFLDALRTLPLGEAASRAAEVEGFDLAANIAGLFEAGAIADVELA